MIFGFMRYDRDIADTHEHTFLPKFIPTPACGGGQKLKPGIEFPRELWEAERSLSGKIRFELCRLCVCALRVLDNYSISAVFVGGWSVVFECLFEGWSVGNCDVLDMCLKIFDRIGLFCGLEMEWFRFFIVPESLLATWRSHSETISPLFTVFFFILTI